jgi:hypothetical protein
MKKKYRVIWFDDEHETRTSIREQAHLNGITLYGYNNAQDGIKELQSNIKFYDAAILDGLFYLNPNEMGMPTSDDAVGEVAKELLKLENVKILPRFILSGQESFTKEKNKVAEVLMRGQVFDKLGGKEHLEELWNKIKEESDKLPETQARHNNPEIFEIFDLGYLPHEMEDNVLELINKPLPSSNSELKDILANIRSIHESCLLKLEGIKVLDSSLRRFKDKMKHLSGNLSEDRNWEPVTPVYQTKDIKNLQEWIYYTCGTYIHYLEEQHNDEYIISRYAVESLRQGVFEILLWFKKTYAENV